MKCSTHPDVDAVGVCVNCGKAVCATCRTLVGEKSYCPTCATGVSVVEAVKLTAKPIAGGILGITSGVMGLFLGFLFIVGGTQKEYYWEQVDWSAVGLGIAGIILGIVAIVGSSFAIARKNIVLAAIGGVCALLTVWPLGFPALILIGVSRGEFQHAPSTLICINCGKKNPKGGRFCSHCGRELRWS